MRDGLWCTAIQALWKYSGFFRILVSLARVLAAIPVEIGVDCSENGQDRSTIQDQCGKPTAK